MLIKIKAYTLIEMLLAITILSLIYCGGTATFARLNYLVKAKINIHIVETALSYAKSLATLSQTTVVVCGSLNGYKCSGSWNNGILVHSPLLGQSKYFKLYPAQQTTLTLHQSGNTNNQVQVQPNTMTYTNGHFIYKSLKASTMPQFKLYFNKALKIYHLVGN